MIGVVGDGDFLAEKRFAQAIVEAGALISQRSGGKIVKKKTDQIENGGGFEDHGVFSRREFLRIFRHLELFRWRGRRALADQCFDTAGVSFGPTCCGLVRAW